MNLLSGVNQDFHRPQKSPGGYEWWHFDGTDGQSGLSFSLQFYAGNLFSAYYQDNLKTYWQKTKSPLVDDSVNTESFKPNLFVVNPPNPLDYCGVAFRIFRNNSLIGESLQEFSGKFLNASDHRGAVKLGPNRFNWDEGGNPPSYVLSIQSPLQRRKGYLRARLFFTPLSIEMPPLPQPEIPSTHNWVLAAPHCHVEGTLQWCNILGEVEKEEGFIGKGFHDHHWGSVPLERFIKSWHWGRTFIGDRTFIYSIQTPIKENEKTESILLVMNKEKVETISRSSKIQFNCLRHNFFWLPYIKSLLFNDPYKLKIIHTNILSDGPVSLIFQDQLVLKNSAESLKGFGISNYLYTPRLSSKYFFPMLKSRTTVYTRPDEPSTGFINQPGGDVFTDRSAL
jgi:carotenoid 1,2-hydratase